MAGAALYYDAYADDARVTLENVLDATFHGAVALNYVELSSFSRIDGKLGAASVIDGEGKSGFEIRARSFINAAGPWSDDIRRMDDPGCRPAVRLTKGVHLIVPAVHLSIRVPLVLTDQGGRIVFAIPFGRFVIVGTTDTDFEGDRELVGADASDETYLLEVVAGAIRGFNPSRDKVAYRFAGLRALELTGGQRPSAVARDEVIVESPSGLITVAGGKLTTHREVAERIVDRLVRTLGKGSRRCPTRETPMPGARPFDAGIDARDVLDPEVWQALERRYGTRAEAVARIVRENSEMARPLALDPLVIAAEAVHAVRNEFARTITDFIERRTGLVWRAPDIALKAAESAIPVMAAELNWNRARQEAEAAAFEANFNRSSRTKPEEHP
jgi:glycerol-3-phosphate dehydrogenase